MARRKVACDALVLSSADSGADRVVHLLTDRSQHVPAVARAARRSSKRFSGNLQPLTQAGVELTVDASRDLARVDQARARAVFGVLKGDLVRFGLGSVMSDVVLHLVPEHVEEPGAYELTLRAWQALDDPRRAASEDLLLLFELRMLGLAGILEPVDTLPITPGAREVLTGWQEGRWAPLAAADRPGVGRALEMMIQAASGRRLKSRTFLDDVLSG